MPGKLTNPLDGLPENTPEREEARARVKQFLADYRTDNDDGLGSDDLVTLRVRAQIKQVLTDCDDDDALATLLIAFMSEHIQFAIAEQHEQHENQGESNSHSSDPQ